MSNTSVYRVNINSCMLQCFMHSIIWLISTICNLVQICIQMHSKYTLLTLYQENNINMILQPVRTYENSGCFQVELLTDTEWSATQGEVIFYLSRQQCSSAIRAIKSASKWDRANKHLIWNAGSTSRTQICRNVLQYLHRFSHWSPLSTPSGAIIIQCSLS